MTRTHCLIVASILCLAALPACAGDTKEVKVVDRQNHDRTYTYVVPGNSTSNSNTRLNCFGNGSNVNCSGTTATTDTINPTLIGSYSVTGATFSLQLPDGRIAVVNCESKVAIGFAAGARVHRRSCRMPIVNDIQVEFSGDDAKLKWPVSIDGKKMVSETYKILGVLDKPGGASK